MNEIFTALSGASWLLRALEHPLYLAPPVLASLLVYMKALHPHRLNLTITVFDAGGLALFTVTGVMLAHGMGLHPVSTVVVAVIGTIGGGVLRDIVANEVPAIFDPRGVYAVPPLVGASVATTAAMLGALNAVTGMLIAALIFTVRMLGHRFQWRLPGSDISQDRESLERLRRLATQAQAVAARRVERSREVTVVDAASQQSVRLDPVTGTMDVTDLRTGRTRSYDGPGPRGS